MKIKKNFIIISTLVIILAVICVSVFAKVEEKPKYVLKKLERSTIVETIEASGTINPVKTVSIGSQVSGMISAIYVDYNSRVKKGELLAQIDPSLFQAQVDQANATLSSKKADYQKTKSLLIYDEANYKRYKELYKKRYVSKNDLERQVLELHKRLRHCGII